MLRWPDAHSHGGRRPRVRGHVLGDIAVGPRLLFPRLESHPLYKGQIIIKARKQALQNHTMLNIPVFLRHFCLPRTRAKRRKLSALFAHILSQEKQLVFTLKVPPQKQQQCQRQSPFVDSLISHQGTGSNSGPSVCCWNLHLEIGLSP